MPESAVGITIFSQQWYFSSNRSCSFFFLKNLICSARRI